jgi:hypothetical protein
MREKRVVLKDHGGRALLRRQVVDAPSADQDVAVGDGLEARDHAQRGGLPAAGGAEKGDELALRDGEVEIDDGGRAVVVDLAHLDQFEVKGHGISLPRPHVVIASRRRSNPGPLVKANVCGSPSRLTQGVLPWIASLRSQ